MNNDLTFITNELGNKLVDRFNTLIKDTQFFDCLVGYFYTSGFHSLYRSLENTEKIRVLIGISTDKRTFDIIQESKSQTFILSHKETKDNFSDKIIEEMEKSEDSLRVEEGIKKFIEWLNLGKLEIRVYPSEKIHSKLYIMGFKEEDRDSGRVITGSSNFTKSGLTDNLEFNVELKNSSDFNYALSKFNELWKNSIEVTEEYVNTVKKKTWLNDSITPYELYLKFLYEYLKEKINIDQEELKKALLPENFMDLQYQKDAVRDAKMKLEEYGGVFISDVVGLGKTYICALLAQQLEGRSLVIAPPILIDRGNPGSWRNVFGDFGVRGPEFESRGKLDKLIDEGTDKYMNVFIDESHDFRNEATQSYAKLSQICQGKRVILVSATPLNNTPMDILSQIKLFQSAHKSTLPHPKVRDLEKYFRRLQNRLKGLDRQKDRDEYLRIVQENAKEIREDVLQYLMVRRTRSSITKYYGKDLEKQGLKFPEVEDPKPIYYQFDEYLDEIFNRTLKLIIKDFKYARYTPLLYLKKKIRSQEAPQRNMGKFMKILLLKRLESSFCAFKQTVNRFIISYTRFIEEYKKGNVYVSKSINKIFELLENDDIESIQKKFIDKGNASKYSSSSFIPDFIEDLESDLKVLKEINDMWNDITEDPKLEEFIGILTNDRNLKNRVIVFTESKETAFYLEKELNPLFDNKVMAFSGDSSENVRRKIIKNFDANEKNQEDDCRILISTDVLSQGVSLHRSNVVINYDIPWNPTRMMQRVGRVERVNSKFDKIYTYNFFPAGQIDKNISLEDAAKSKITAFIEMLGNDSKLLTDEEIKSHDLFTRLISKDVLIGDAEEEDLELKYLTFLREIRDNNSELFEKIKRLPKKARTSRKCLIKQNSLLTFFRKGKLRKIFMTHENIAKELDFIEAAQILEVEENIEAEKIDAEFYKHLELNKKGFESVFIIDEYSTYRGKSHSRKLITIINAVFNGPNQFTEIEEEYLQEVLELLEEGKIPQKIIKEILKELNGIEGQLEPLKIFKTIKSGVPSEFFQEKPITTSADIFGPKEIILSEYLIKGD
ncbi:helicase-related protein [Methanobacterium sp.]|uniref:helicase-related protein n=1 Tax=Methanobacterium sp. TaxID=2164 RepID=UPI003158A16A